MADTDPIPNAGVHFPPPFVYVSGLLIGWCLHVWRPIGITDGPSAAREIAGIVGILICAVILTSAFLTFRRARTAVIPNRPATTLVTHGPYRFTRNPMYVSLTALYAGLSLLLDSWWPFILLPLVLVGIDRFVIAREERYLASAFPAEYRAYTQRVRRWV